MEAILLPQNALGLPRRGTCHWKDGLKLAEIQRFLGGSGLYAMERHLTEVPRFEKRYTDPVRS